MISRAEISILYPNNVSIDKKCNSTPTVLPYSCKVPCASYEFSKEKLDTVFKEIGNCNPEHIFVFGQLRQGKINFDDSFKIYTNEDCQIEDPLLVKDDEVCSEEYCAEVLLPYCDVYFPNSTVNQFLANDFSPLMEQFTDKLKKEYPNSLFLFSEFNPID